MQLHKAAHERGQVIRIGIELVVQGQPSLPCFFGDALQDLHSLLAVLRWLAAGKGDNRSRKETPCRGRTDRLKCSRGLCGRVTGGVQKELMKPAVVDLALERIYAVGHSLSRAEGVEPIPIAPGKHQIAECDSEGR